MCMWLCNTLILGTVASTDLATVFLQQILPNFIAKSCFTSTDLVTSFLLGTKIMNYSWKEVVAFTFKIKMAKSGPKIWYHSAHEYCMYDTSYYHISNAVLMKRLKCSFWPSIYNSTDNPFGPEGKNKLHTINYLPFSDLFTLTHSIQNINVSEPFWDMIIFNQCEKFQSSQELTCLTGIWEVYETIVYYHQQSFYFIMIDPLFEVAFKYWPICWGPDCI